MGEEFSLTNCPQAHNSVSAVPFPVWAFEDCLFAYLFNWLKLRGDYQGGKV